MWCWICVLVRGVQQAALLTAVIPLGTTCTSQVLRSVARDEELASSCIGACLSMLSYLPLVPAVLDAEAVQVRGLCTALAGYDATWSLMRI